MGFFLRLALGFGWCAHLLLNETASAIWAVHKFRSPDPKVHKWVPEWPAAAIAGHRGLSDIDHLGWLHRKLRLISDTKMKLSPYFRPFDY